MRYALCLLLVIALAACDGGDSDSDTNTQQSQAVTPAPDSTEGTAAADATLSFEELAQDVLGDAPPSQVIPSQTPASEGALEIPLPGTLVASETEQPENTGVMFESIRFRQTGGTSQSDVQFEIRGLDRVVIRDGVTMPLSQETVDQIDQMINDLNFIGLQGTFLGPAASEDVYVYRVTVIKGEDSRTITAQDGFIPEQYKQFLGFLRSIGDSVVVTSN